MKSHKILLHGSRVPGWTVFTVLIIEYVLYITLNSCCTEDMLLAAGYAALVLLITCNSHGRNVRIRYEQELSLLLKCMLTNIVYGVFGSAVYVGDTGYILRCLELTFIQLISIIVMCAIARRISVRGYDKKRLYLYDGAQPDISGVPGAECAHVDAADMTVKLIDGFDEVYLHELSVQQRNDYIKLCFEKNIPVYFSTKLTDMELRGATLAQDGETPIFYKGAYGMGRKTSVLKRGFDIAASVLSLIILSPLFAAISVAIKLDDGGDVFFRQIRCTKNMREFSIIKFRSMIMGAEENLGPKIADSRDSRMTRVGYILRKYKLDELPQLINILKGDMSFVGPRPERPEIIAGIVKNVPEYTYRTTVPAGLTGYAQVHGDYHTQFTDKLKWDLMYIENHSVMLDIKIMLMTVMVILRGSDDV